MFPKNKKGEFIMYKRTISMILIRSFFLFLFIALMAPACTRSEEEKKQEVVVKEEKVLKDENILANIDGEPITKADIIKRIKFRRADLDESKVDPNQWQRMLKGATEEAISDRLLLKAAQSEGITATQEQVDFSLKRSKAILGEEKFQEMLSKSGASEEEYREFIKSKIITSKYQLKLFATIKIDDSKITEYYDEHKEDLFTPESVRLEMIILEKRDDADVIYNRLKEGEDFDKVVQEYTAIYKKRIGGKVKWMPYDAIPEQIRPLVKEGKAGELLEPAQIPEGYSVIKILEKRPEGIPELDEVRGDIEQVFRMKEQQKILENWFASAKQKTTIEYMN